MKVFIGLSASTDINKEYYELAEDIATYLVSIDYELVCGASCVGMPKVISDIFEKKTTVDLFINKKYQSEMDGISIDYNLCDNTFERLKNIYDISDLYIILPGGIGTLSELFGIYEEARGCNKRIILFNYKSYYDFLLKFMLNAIDENFINIDDYNNIKVVTNMEELKKEVIKNER